MKTDVITDKGYPRQIRQTVFPQAGYNHAGTLHSSNFCEIYDRTRKLPSGLLLERVSVKKPLSLDEVVGSVNAGDGVIRRSWALALCDIAWGVAGRAFSDNPLAPSQRIWRDGKTSEAAKLTT